ncbi:MAG: hypothetical protein DRG78_01460 [Epsilonproteobacteria bacterium]|nr:MAG: hypothetical protein DRG78_01460 [Campylobacterota bacterium]
MHKIDTELITKFNEKINSNSYFVLHKYRDIENKNKWSIICSCMDWISVALTNVNNIKEDNLDINRKSMQVFSYISSIDIIYEAINQLHRVIVDENSIPFKNNVTIFTNNTLDKDDNEYFKHIRSIFGAHPVNIKDENGKLFASWPYDSHTKDYDLQVSLYSNNVGQNDITFGIKFSELHEFLYQRYTYLNTIIDNIDIQYDKYIAQKKSQLIEKNENITQQLEILQHEAKDRLNNEYYTSTIDDLLQLFDTNDLLEDNIESQYRKELTKVIDEIFRNLQEMNIVDLSTHNIIYPDYSPSLTYEISKLLPILSLGNNDPMFSYYIKRINNESNKQIIIDEEDSYNLIFLKIKTIMYYKMWA